MPHGPSDERCNRRLGLLGHVHLPAHLCHACALLSPDHILIYARVLPFNGRVSVALRGLTPLLLLL